MIGPKPKFFDSPYFVMDEDNWHLKPGAPEDIQKEFDEYMNPVPKRENAEPVKKSFTDQINELLKPFSNK